MDDKEFVCPMKKSERIMGWMYVFIHIFALPLFLPLMLEIFAVFTHTEITEPQLNLIYYIIGFVFCCTVMMEFLKNSFFDLCDGFMKSMSSIFTGLMFYYAASYVVNFVLMFVVADLVNPNTDAVIENYNQATQSMFMVSVILAPILEETIFRGVVFGTICEKNRAAAYIVSTLLFSLYHVWQFAFLGYNPLLLLAYACQYLPASIIFARTYEKSGSLWTGIVMHMAVNYIALLVSSFT